MALSGARRAWLIWALVLPVALWVPIRLFGLESGSLLVALMTFTPYVAIAALFVAGVAVALRNWAAAAVAALAMVCLAALVLPRVVGETTPVDGHETLTVLSANVYNGSADPAALVGMVERLRPDLLSIQELTPEFAYELRGLGIEPLLPHAIVAMQPGWGGRGIYSRLPLRPLREGAGARTELPRVEVELPSSRLLRVVDVHPHTAVSGPEARWRHGLERLPSTGVGTPWVLVGDFNASLDHAALREVLDRGYRDAGDATGEGLEPTWPEGHRIPPLITIDHVLADRRLGIADYEVLDLPDSDHRAVYARLVLP